MTIEFHCPQCSKLLRTAADKAGARAKCPQCGAPVTVPPQSDSHETPFLEPDESWDEEGALAGAAAAAESRSPGLRRCPTCGERTASEAIACEYCGESLDPHAAAAASRKESAPGSRRTLEAGDILSRSWKIMQRHLGLCMTLAWLPDVIVGSIGGVILEVGEALNGGKFAGPNVAGPPPALVMFLGVFLPVLRWHFGLGRTLAFLKLVRGERVDVLEVFRGGRFLFRQAASALLKNLMNVVALVVLSVPFGLAIAAVQGQPEMIAATVLVGVVLGGAAYVALVVRYWPFTHILVDRDSPGTSCLKEASDLTQGYRMATVGLGLLAGLMLFLGYVAFCIGILFAWPLCYLMFTVAYCDMTDQPTIDV